MARLLLKNSSSFTTGFLSNKTHLGWVTVGPLIIKKVGGGPISLVSQTRVAF